MEFPKNFKIKLYFLVSFQQKTQTLIFIIKYLFNLDFNMGNYLVQHLLHGLGKPSKNPIRPITNQNHNKKFQVIQITLEFQLNLVINIT